MDNTKNTLRYMMSFLPDSIFRGFIPVESWYGLCPQEEERNPVTLMAVHDEGRVDRVRSDDEIKEEAQISSGLLYLVCIYGTDNGSYMKRFADLTAFSLWFGSVGVYKPDEDPDVLWYNS